MAIMMVARVDGPPASHQRALEVVTEAAKLRAMCSSRPSGAPESRAPDSRLDGRCSSWREAGDPRAAASRRRHAPRERSLRSPSSRSSRASMSRSCTVVAGLVGK